MGAAQLNAMLDESVDRYSCRPAVMCGDHETDFERFDESVEWLIGDLCARGVQRRQRIGLCISGGWEFLLAFHALVRLDTVVVPVDPFDEASLGAAGELDLHFILSHRTDELFLEETVELICGEEMRPTSYVAEEFTLVAVSEQAPLHGEAGLLLSDIDFRFWTQCEVVDRIGDLRSELDLNPDARALICGPWSCASAVLLVLACAAAGSCVEVPADRGSGTGPGGVATEDVSVVFAPPMLMHDLVRLADPAAGALNHPRMMLPDGEVLPEVVLRRRGLKRQTLNDPPVYEFASTRPARAFGPAELRPVS